METFRAKGSTFEIDNRGGVINLAISAGGNTVTLSLSVVEASQLVALLHKQINEAAVEKLRTRNQ